ncbi:MAG: hypothetical protein IJQ74_02635, partial [Synergistaceae bacterium]|nr:hypothetical protein [Synergistaceae bacterium]
MAYNFDVLAAERLFLSFLRDNFNFPESSVIADGEFHRFRTAQDKRSDNSGSYYMSHDDWPHGYAKDWRTGLEMKWSFPRDKLDEEGRKHFTDKEYKAAIERARLHHKKAMEKLAIEQANASARARDLFNHLPQAPEDHPYLVKKHVRNLGLRYYDKTGALAVPLRNIRVDVAS